MTEISSDQRHIEAATMRKVGLYPMAAGRDVAAVMRSQEMSARLSEQGFEFAGGGPDELKDVMEQDLLCWQEVIGPAGLRAGE